MASPTLWIIRHGETEWSLSGQHTGRTDIPLTDQGRKQAQSLTDRLKGQKFDQVFCSPLQRAQETCALAGLRDQAQLAPDLMEWDYGIYEGRTSADILKAEPGWSLWTSDVQNGENKQHVQDRLTRFLQPLLDQGGTIALVAHGHILCSLIGLWIANDVSQGKHFTLETASISILGTHRGTRIVRKLNG